MLLPFCTSSLNSGDDYTNIFCNLFCQDEYRSILEETLEIEEIRNKKIVSIATNQQIEDGSRPDAIITFEGDITLLFEVKISTWRDLTYNQPSSYLNHLSKQKGPVYFILLIPDRYQHLMEFKERYCKWENDAKLDIPLKIIYWQSIKKAINETRDKVLLNFANMLNLEYMEEIVVMDDFEIDLLEKDFIYKFNKKITDIIEYAASNMFKKGVQCAPCKDDEGLTYFVKNGNEDLFWFGTWNPICELGSILVVGCNFSHNFAKIFEKLEKNGKSKIYNDQYYIPFTKEEIRDKSNIGESFFKFVYSIYEEADK